MPTIQNLGKQLVLAWPLVPWLNSKNIQDYDACWNSLKSLTDKVDVGYRWSTGRCRSESTWRAEEERVGGCVCRVRRAGDHRGRRHRWLFEVPDHWEETPAPGTGRIGWNSRVDELILYNVEFVQHIRTFRRLYKCVYFFPAIIISIRSVFRQSRRSFPLLSRGNDGGRGGRLSCVAQWHLNYSGSMQTH